MSTDPQPPDGFTLDAEQSRQEEAAKEGIVGRDVDPVDEIGDPPDPDPDGDGSAADDGAVDDPDDDGSEEDV